MQSNTPDSTQAKTASTEKSDPLSVAQRPTGAIPLEQVKLKIGDALQLQFQSDTDKTRCIVTLIGYLTDESVIVTTPMMDEKVMMVREGQIFVIRLFSGKNAYAFTSTANKVSHTPYPHIHLSYPKEVRVLVVRSSTRAQANIICHASDENGKGFAGVARDISVGGALIAVREQIGQVGDKLFLALRVHINEIEHMLDLNCIIRSVNVADTKPNETALYLHGLSFEKPGSQDILVLTALLYQNLVNDQEANNL